MCEKESCRSPYWKLRPNGGKKRNSASLDTFLSTANALDKQLSAKPVELFADMGEAHAKLTTALKDEIHSFTDARVAVERLANDAQDLIQSREEL